MIAPPNLLESLAHSVESEFAGSIAELTNFPSGGAMLDVRRGDGRLFVMSYTPQFGYAVDEVQPNEGWTTGYQFVSPEFAPAAQKLRSLLGERDPGNNGDGAIALSLLVVYTLDLDAAVRFYSALGLPLKPEKHGRGPEHFSAKLAGIVLELYPCTAARPSGGARLGFRVAELETTVAKLRKQSAKVLKEPHDSPWGRRAVVEDFDGNQVELTAV
jgi:predicted enzyme related to lactoylglutathione lyase